jgi:hypothetical protein
MKYFIVFSILILIVIEIIVHCIQLHTTAKNNPEKFDKIQGRVWYYFVWNGLGLGLVLGVLIDMF